MPNDNIISSLYRNHQKLLLLICTLSLILLLSIILVAILPTSIPSSSLATVESGGNYDKKYVGVVFSPYGKNNEGPSTFVPWNSYSRQEVRTMLKLVSTKFRNISTYGVGTASEESNWENGDAVGFTGVEAAELNKESSSTVISVALAIWQHDYESWVKNAIKTALDITETANKIHKGTVWGITLTSNYVVSLEQADRVDRVLGMLQVGRNTSISRNIPIKFGIRLSICDMVPGHGNKDNLIRILEKFDYLICFKNPPNEPARAGVHSAVTNMADAMKTIKSGVKAINQKLEVIFETGWPSAGISGERLSTTTKNLKEYWAEISIWAVANKIPLFLFAAMDEPWKSTLSSDKNSPVGPCGAEGHFGWWRRVDNKDSSVNSYIQKINEPEREVCATDASAPLSTGAIVGIVLGVVLFLAALLAIAFLYFRLQKTKAEKLTEEEIAEFEQGVNLTDEEAENLEVALRLPYNRNYELEKDKFQIDKHAVLGSGAFGIVYKGKIDGNVEDVAFKTTKPQCPVENLKSLMSEIKLMVYLGHHENIVGLVAAYTGGLRDGEVFIASEYCANGSLESFLRSSQDKYVNVKLQINDGNCEFYNEDERYVNSPRIVAVNLDKENVTLCLKNFIKWSYEIANGMDYLGSKKVIHADLATRNVLLSGTGTAKITDFGLSRKLYAYTSYVKKKEEPLPWRWMSIESLRQLAFSTQSDVWSYGVTLWEIFSLGDVPYPGLGWDIDFLEKLNQGLRLKKPEDATPEIYAEMSKCWNKNPELRPTFRELADYFFNLHKNYVEANYENLGCGEK